MYVELVSEPDNLVFVLLLHDDVCFLELLEGMLYPVHFHQLYRTAIEVRFNESGCIALN